MHPEPQAHEFFARYGVADLPRVSDPEQRLYTAFGLGAAGAKQFVAPRAIVRYLGTMARGHLPALVGGNVLRMPGAFLLANGEIVKAFRPDSVAARFDLEDLATCPVRPPATTG